MTAAKARLSATRRGAADAGPGLRKARAGASAAAPSPPPQPGMRLHTADGARKYLTAGEREAFLGQAERADR